jgi:hypothetical protein
LTIQLNILSKIYLHQILVDTQKRQVAAFQGKTM